MYQKILPRRIRKNVRYLNRIIWERIRGLDFSTFLEPESFGFDAATSYPYEATPANILMKIISSLDIAPSDRLLDIGCGKGYALYVFNRFPFGSIDGVEISSKLAKIARSNLKKLKIRSNIYVSDIIRFQYLDRYNFFYLFNPFPVATMKVFLDNLKTSASRAPRNIRILYLNPTCHSLVDKYAATAQRHEVYVGRIKCDFHVYVWSG